MSFQKMKQRADKRIDQGVGDVLFYESNGVTTKFYGFINDTEVLATLSRLKGKSINPDWIAKHIVLSVSGSCLVELAKSSIVISGSTRYEIVRLLEKNSGEIAFLKPEKTYSNQPQSSQYGNEWR